MSNVCWQRVCNLASFSMTEKTSRLPKISSLCSVLHKPLHPIHLLLQHTAVPPVVSSETTSLALLEQAVVVSLVV